MKLTNKLNYLAFFVFVLICFIICGNTGIIAFANTLNVGNITNMDVEVRKVEMFDYFVDCMNQIYATNVKRGNIRALEDFAGNKYTLVECIPQGYLIYNNSSGNVIEYSATSSSPYLKKTGTILYGGPSFFVYKNNNVYNHIITEQQYSEEQVQILTTSSNTLYQESCNNPNNDVLSYINKGEVSNVINVDQTGKLVTNAGTRASFSYVSNYDFFTNLSGTNLSGESGYRMGYVSGGYCGFIGANILLAYYGVHRDANYLNGYNIIAQDVNGVYRITNTSLTNRIINMGVNYYNYNLGSGTIASQMSTYVEKHFELKGINKPCYYKLVPTATRVKNYIVANIPVELFALLHDPRESDTSIRTEHAIVVYGYCTNSGNALSRFGFMTHYGWEGYTQVAINTTSDINGWFGSMMTFEET